MRVKEVSCGLFILQYGTSALVWATRKGHKDVVEKLLEKGANVDTAGTVRSIYASINVRPEGGGPRAYVGHLTFQKNF